MFVKKLWIFEFNFSLLMSFLLVVDIGIIIFGLIYLILVLSTIKNITDAEIKQLIEETKTKFNDKILKGNKSNFGHFKGLCFDLVKNIAYKFFS